MKISEKIVSLKDGQNARLLSAGPEHAELILQHLQISHAESYRNLNQTAAFWRQFSIEEEKRILSDFESAKNKFMLVAFVGDKIIGGLGLVGQGAEFNKHNASLGLSIQKAYCNTGLGTQLMTYAMTMAKEAGFHRIELTVRTYNKPGLALYEKLGFQRIGLLKDVAFIDGKFEDEFSFQKILDY